MSYLKRQGGVTLVELVLVLAITAGALASAIAIRGSLQRDISFSTAIEQVKNQIVAVKTESIQTVKEGADGAGSSDANVFGKVVEFSPDAGADEDKFMKVSTLVVEKVGSNKNTMKKCDQRLVELKNQVRFEGAEKQAIVFQRNPDTTFVPPQNYNEDHGESGRTCEEIGDSLGLGTDYGGYDSDNDGIPDSEDDCDSEFAPGTADGCLSPPPPPPADECDSTGYTCGLYGNYYNGINLSGDPVSAFNGESFGAQFGTSSTFLPLLRYKAKNPATRVSAYWSGQIRIPANTQRRFCLNSDDGSYMGIDGTIVTNNLDSYDNQPNRCGNFNNNTGQDQWLNIRIIYNQLDTSELTPYIGLVYKGQNNADVYVPASDLRSPPFAQILPTSAVSNGLRGEYFNNNTLSGDPISVWTDSADDKPPYLIMSTGTGFTDIFRYRIGWTGPGSFSGSVRWTGQINQVSPNERFCIRAGDGVVSIKIGGQSFDNTSTGASVCEASKVNSTGWQNVEIEYKTTTFLPKGVSVSREVANTAQLFRRSLDWSDNTVKYKASSSSYNILPLLDKSCTDQNTNVATNPNAISYSKSGLWPSSNYKLDLTYSNEVINTLKVPSNYQYKVCIRVNGEFLNNNKEISLPFNPNDSFRSITLDNIAVNSDGQMNIDFFWMNDAYSPTNDLNPLNYDANFRINRLDLWRGFDNTGNLISLKNDDQSIKAESKFVAFLKRVSSPANAQLETCPGAPADCSILSVLNYEKNTARTHTFYPSEADFIFGWEGSPNKGTIKIDPQTNSITRDIDL